MAGTQVTESPDSGVDLVKVESSKLAEVISGMSEFEVENTTSAEETGYRIMAEIMAAESEDEMWKDLPTWSSKNSVGMVFKIGEIRGVFKSKFPDPDTGKSGAFLACTATDTESGELGVFTSSAIRVCARLGWYHEHDAFPVVVEVIKKGETDKGFPILDLVKAGA